MHNTSTARDLFLYHLRDSHNRGFQPTESPDSTLTTATDGTHTITIDARPLVTTEDPAWNRRREQLEAALAEDLPARVTLWIPAGADLPDGEPATSDFIAQVRQSAVKLGPHERSYVPFPATLYLRKNAAEGGVISVTGGLNPHWARFTERVRGQFDLDSTALHRLPESGEHLETLIDQVVQRSQELDIKQVGTIETIDAWTLQRLSGENGFTIAGVSPVDAADLGLAVRRNFRRIVLDSRPRLREAQSDLRALVVQGPYARIEQEGAATALRGYDPAAYSGIDFIVLVADGLVRPLIQPSEAQLPWNRAAAR